VDLRRRLYAQRRWRSDVYLGRVDEAASLTLAGGALFLLFLYPDSSRKPAHT
jgi:hypothetical protein